MNGNFRTTILNTIGKKSHEWIIWTKNGNVNSSDRTLDEWMNEKILRVQHNNYRYYTRD